MGIGGTGLEPGSSGGVNYSTTEQDTGLKWIDGSTIYQKTVNYGTLPNNGDKSVAHSITNLDVIMEATGWFKNGSGLHMPLNFAFGSTDANHVGGYIDSTNIITRTGTDRSGFSGYVTIQYTKT